MTTPSTSQPMGYGSDLVVDLLRAVGVEHVAINPGATMTTRVKESLALVAAQQGIGED